MAFGFRKTATAVIKPDGYIYIYIYIYICLLLFINLLQGRNIFSNSVGNSDPESEVIMYVTDVQLILSVLEPL